MGMWSDDRGVNMLDTGAPYYDTYTCADGRFVAVGAIEPQFYAELLASWAWTLPTCRTKTIVSRWPELRAKLTRGLRVAGSRSLGPKVFTDSDACLHTVLSFGEVESEPHNTERDTFYRENDYLFPRTAAAVSRTVPSTPSPPGALRGPTPKLY